MYVDDTAYTSGKVLTQWQGFSTTSDAKKKEVLGAIDCAKEFISKLNPVQFYWKESQNKKISFGFTAQEINKIGKDLGLDLNMTTAEYAGEVEKIYHGEDVDDKELDWFLSYEEIIAPLVKVVQDKKKEIDYLKEEINELKNK